MRRPNLNKGGWQGWQAGTASSVCRCLTKSLPKDKITDWKTGRPPITQLTKLRKKKRRLTVAVTDQQHVEAAEADAALVQAHLMPFNQSAAKQETLTYTVSTSTEWNSHLYLPGQSSSPSVPRLICQKVPVHLSNQHQSHILTTCSSKLSNCFAGYIKIALRIWTLAFVFTSLCSLTGHRKSHISQSFNRKIRSLKMWDVAIDQTRKLTIRLTIMYS